MRECTHSLGQVHIRCGPCVDKRIATLEAEVSSFKACVGTIRQYCRPDFGPENISAEHVERYTREMGALRDAYLKCGKRIAELKAQLARAIEQDYCTFCGKALDGGGEES